MYGLCAIAFSTAMNSSSALSAGRIFDLLLTIVDGELDALVVRDRGEDGGLDSDERMEFSVG